MANTSSRTLRLLSLLQVRRDGVDVLRIDGDRIVEVRLFSSDQDAEDAFWGV